MALPPPKTFRQDLPPAGGFTKPADFPVAGYRKRSPNRMPHSIYIAAAVAGVVLVGWWRMINDMEERKYYNLSRWNERFERGYVMQAQENVKWQRKQKEFLDKERELMSDVDGWVVGRRRFFTQWEDKPDIDRATTSRQFSPY